MTGQLGWGLTSQIGCRRPHWMTHYAPPPTHLRSCGAPLWPECHNKCPTYAGWWWKGGAGQMAQFLPHYCAAQFPPRIIFNLFAPNRETWMQMYSSEGTAPPSYFYLYRKKLVVLWQISIIHRPWNCSERKNILLIEWKWQIPSTEIVIMPRCLSLSCIWSKSNRRLACRLNAMVFVFVF